MSEVRVEGLDVRLGRGADAVTVLHDVGLHVAPGEVLGLLGPNGSGKSTLLRALYGSQRPTRGQVVLDGLDVARARRPEVARRCAVVTQDHATDLQLSVLDVVLLGRIPHGRTGSDLALAERSLRRVDAEHLADRGFATLSGGERQRVLLARALCQEPRVLLLDEPTNHLDVTHQIALMRLVGDLATTCVVALHDLTLAAAHCDRVALLRAGRLVAVGPPLDVLTPERVEDVYGVACEVLTHPLTGRPLLALASRETVRPPTEENHVP